MATGAVIAGTTLAGGSRIYGGLQARKAAKKQQANLDAQAILEREAAEFQALQAERRFDKLLGTQKARISGSGIKLEGSPMDILEQTLNDQRETITNIRQTGDSRARALQDLAGNARDAGRNALTASVVGAFGTGLKSVQKYNKLKEDRNATNSTKSWSTSIS